MSKQMKKQETAEIVARAFQISSLIVGFSLLVISRNAQNDWNDIPFGIGIAFLTTSLSALFKNWIMGSGSAQVKYSFPENSGLVEILEFRMIKNVKINDYIEKKATIIDVMTQDSLHGLRRDMRNELANRLIHGLKMRILLPSEKERRHFTKGKELIEWWRDLPESQRNNITIRRYDGTPQDLYFRVDDMIFVGPYILGVYSNQTTITYEFELFHSANEKKTNTMTMAGKFYYEYFEKIWFESAKHEIKYEKP